MYIHSRLHFSSSIRRSKQCAIGRNLIGRSFLYTPVSYFRDAAAARFAILYIYTAPSFHRDEEYICIRVGDSRVLVPAVLMHTYAV